LIANEKRKAGGGRTHFKAVSIKAILYFANNTDCPTSKAPGNYTDSS